MSITIIFILTGCNEAPVAKMEYNGGEENIITEKVIVENTFTEDKIKEAIYNEWHEIEDIKQVDEVNMNNITYYEEDNGYIMVQFKYHTNYDNETHCMWATLCNFKN